MAPTSRSTCTPRPPAKVKSSTTSTRRAPTKTSRSTSTRRLPTKKRNINDYNEDDDAPRRDRSRSSCRKPSSSRSTCTPHCQGQLLTSLWRWWRLRMMTIKKYEKDSYHDIVQYMSSWKKLYCRIYHFDFCSYGTREVSWKETGLDSVCEQNKQVG